MGLRRLIIGTGNAKKLAEIRELLEGLEVDVKSIEDVCPGLPSPEETGTTFQENSALKALYFAQHAGALCLADDSGLEVDALDGAPGVHSSRYGGEDGNDALNNARLLKDLEGVEPARRGAQFRAVVTMATPGGVLTSAEGVVRGTILESPRGEGGFGYDPLFFYPDFDATFAEVSREQKASVSHRGKALAEVREQLPAVLTILRNRSSF